MEIIWNILRLVVEGIRHIYLQFFAPRDNNGNFIDPYADNDHGSTRP